MVKEFQERKPEEKPVIVIAAFGSSFPEGQKNLEDADNILTEYFCDYEICWALTSGFIIKKLKSRGQETIFKRMVPIRTLDEVYMDIQKKGEIDVFVQGLYVINGIEYKLVLNTPVKDLNIRYGRPLLISIKNIEDLANILSCGFGDPSDTATILCAHGNGKHPENNSQLIEMDKYIRANFDNTYLACIEGPPGFVSIAEDIAASGVTKVKFIPFMLTYGDHMTNDVMGDEPDSWKTRLGLEASAAGGMASNKKIINYFIKTIESGLSSF
ncbi:MAG: sirohydrochlorin cobaltochelatase [Actinomycetia bacterium]|nr:sirohydrochlorin cobaltochelatase [Actinomycetes bacterium]